jgi:hypothetical protein
LIFLGRIQTIIPNSKIPMSSMPDRKFNSILKRIPVETIFEVLKFLTYEQWFGLQFSNWRLAEIIKKNVNYLAFPKLHSIVFCVRVKYLRPSIPNTNNLVLSTTVFKKYNIWWDCSKGWGFGWERKGNKKR